MESDRQTMAALDGAALSYQLVLTKTDKVSESALAELRKRLSAELARHGAAHPEIIATSAHEGQGIEALRAALAALSTPTPLR